MPTVSVVIPAYNSQATIRETVASIQRQSFTDFELIAIDDGSSDRTVEILKGIVDPRLKVYSFPNSGLSVARNRGIERATSEFISFIDADDLWTENKLARQLETLQQNPQAGVAYSMTLVLGRDGSSIYAGTSATHEGDVLAHLLLNNFIASGSNAMLRRQAIESVGGFDPGLTSCEDWDYWLRLAAIWPFAVVPEAQIFYRQSSRSMSADIEGMEKNFLTVYQRAFARAPERYHHLKHQSLANGYLFLAQLGLRYFTEARNVARAQRHFLHALHLHPPILTQAKARSVALKLLSTRILPPKLSAKLLSGIGKISDLDKYLPKR